MFIKVVTTTTRLFTHRLFVTSKYRSYITYYCDYYNNTINSYYFNCYELSMHKENAY